MSAQRNSKSKTELVQKQIDWNAQNMHTELGMLQKLVITDTENESSNYLASYTSFVEICYLSYCLIGIMFIIHRIAGLVFFFL